jgi:hypothetical protein
VDFVAIPKIKMDTSDIDPLGPDKTMVPSDRNLTIFLDYLKGKIKQFSDNQFLMQLCKNVGTIEQVTISSINETGYQFDLGVFNVTDKFNAREFSFDFKSPHVNNHMYN